MEKVTSNTMRSMTKLVAFIGLLFVQPVQAGLIADELWKVQAGDQLEQIMNDLAPTVRRSAADLTVLVRRLNPAAFDDQGKLIAGRVVRIPGAKLATVRQRSAVTATGENKTPVARVVISNGHLQAIDERGLARPLSRRGQVYEGDKLTTSTSGYAQLRFTDGALIALRPGTEFKVDSYRFSGTEDGTEKGIFSLLKGGFRTISGLIGKKNKQNYRVRTAVATIGIRGTHYGLRLCKSNECGGKANELGLYGGVVDGSIVVTNKAGEKTFNNDQYFHVRNFDSLPKGLLLPPAIIFNGQELKLSELKKQRKKLAKQVRKVAGKKAEQQARLSVGGNTSTEKLVKVIRHNKPEIDRAKFVVSKNVPKDRILTKDAPQGATLLTAGVENALGEIGPPVQTMAFHSDGKDNRITLELDVKGVPSLLEASNSIQRVATLAKRSEKTRVSDRGGNTDFGVVWGRWNNDYRTAVAGVAVKNKGDMHYIYSQQSIPSNDILKLSAATNLPGAGVVNYTGIGGTSPTDLNGNVGKRLSANISVDFKNSKLTQYSVKDNIAGINYDSHLSLDPNGGQIAVGLNQVLNVGIDLQGTCTGGVCGTQTGLTGSAALQFIKRGDAGIPEGAASSYSVTGQAFDATQTAIAVGHKGTILLKKLRGEVLPRP